MKRIPLIKTVWVNSSIVIHVIALTTNLASASECSSELFFSAAGDPSLHTPYLIESEFQKLNIIYQRDIDADNDGRLDLDRFVAALKGIDLKVGDFLVLDWEGIFLKKMNSSSQMHELQEALGQAFVASDIANQISGAKLAFYGMNFQSRHEANLKYRTVFKSLAALTPSLYLSDKPGRYENNSLSAEYKRNLQLRVRSLIQDGDRLDLPVYIFITHRWHPKSVDNNDELVDLELFEEYVDTLFTSTETGDVVDGVIWWFADFVYARTKDVVERDISEYENISDYVMTMHSTYGKIIASRCVAIK